MLLLSTVGAPSWSRAEDDGPEIPTPNATPEIDPGMLRGGLVLLGGGLVILADRRARRRG
jgi:hypothetical protein